jgi:hypothetical protein
MMLGTQHGLRDKELSAIVSLGCETHGRPKKSEPLPSLRVKPTQCCSEQPEKQALGCHRLDLKLLRFGGSLAKSTCAGRKPRQRERHDVSSEAIDTAGR